MPIKQSLTRSYLLERELGVHVWGTDVMKLALYNNDAVLNPDALPVYTATNEITGTGYTAGGVVLALTSGFPKLATGERKVLIDFDDVDINPASWPGQQAHYGLIYNFSKALKSVAVLDFGIGYSVTTRFQIEWPPNDPANCIIRCGAP